MFDRETNGMLDRNINAPQSQTLKNRRDKSQYARSDIISVVVVFGAVILLAWFTVSAQRNKLETSLKAIAAQGINILSYSTIDTCMSGICSVNTIVVQTPDTVLECAVNGDKPICR